MSSTSSISEADIFFDVDEQEAGDGDFGYEGAEMMHVMTADQDALAQPKNRRPNNEAQQPRSRSRSRSFSRPRTSEGLAALKESYRHSLEHPVPVIPSRFLSTPTSATRRDRATATSSTAASHTVTPISVTRESSSEDKRSSLRSPRPKSRGSHEEVLIDHSTTTHQATLLTSPTFSRRKSLPANSVKESSLRYEDQETLSALSGKGAKMGRNGRDMDKEDLFYELAEDSEGRSALNGRPERALSRSSWHGKRQSLPARGAQQPLEERRPRTSGQASARPSSRAGAGARPSELSRHVERYRDQRYNSPSMVDDSVSISGRSRLGRTNRFAAAQDQSPMSPSRFGDRMRSPDLPSFGRRRPSFGAEPTKPYHNRQAQLAARLQDSEVESPAETSEPKRSADSCASIDTEPSTVWDELDDLKSRIKRIELGGKVPPTSNAAITGSAESSERPKTATTAPTTIDSSPKVERKPDTTEVEAQQRPKSDNTSTVGGPGAANIHPLLHAALAKAKPLINAPLYRSLEATASDALQLAVMTGGAGPQGTAFSAASIINGATVADRHVRRKADTMCRNLTDLCLVLCDGKHDAPSGTASPIAINLPDKATPTSRLKSRASLGASNSLDRGASRPMSRLDARRTSLGLPPTGTSPRGSHEELSAYEQESTPSHSNAQQPRRFDRAGSRLQVHAPHCDDVSGDEDPTVRPPSRAMTDIGNLRNKPTVSRDHTALNQQRSPSLRDSLVSRKANAGAHDSNRELSRVSSLTSDTGRRRFMRDSTPPVLEEESSGQEYQPLSQPKRRITSLGQYSARAANDRSSRVSSLSQRRQDVLVE